MNRIVCLLLAAVNFAFAGDGMITNSLGMKFVPVKGTEVLFSIWETRVQDYAAYATQNSGVDSGWKDVEYEGQRQGPDHPVVNVSWDDAVAFCAWLTKEERSKGKIPADASYRLPTDHEWSSAVGIGGQENEKETPKAKDREVEGYPWGAMMPPPLGAGNYDAENITGYDDKHTFTAPVGSYKPTAEGIFDLSGNVWEWCQDWFDPSNPKSRVLRGASWRSGDEFYLRSAFRVGPSPDYRSSNDGFRVVLVPGGSP